VLAIAATADCPFRTRQKMGKRFTTKVLLHQRLGATAAFMVLTLTYPIYPIFLALTSPFSWLFVTL
jgi:hypothetical protein